ncbi:hypothetical protein BGW80DRAFT_1250991 [Lactifluus volemus]|nr:hypothetical protein BGW80DRAFT_1250991 [Lactifluus volemus]
MPPRRGGASSQPTPLQGQRESRQAKQKALQLAPWMSIARKKPQRHESPLPSGARPKLAKPGPPPKPKARIRAASRRPPPVIDPNDDDEDLDDAASATTDPCFNPDDDAIGDNDGEDDNGDDEELAALEPDALQQTLTAEHPRWAPSRNKVTSDRAHSAGRSFDSGPEEDPFNTAGNYERGSIASARQAPSRRELARRSEVPTWTATSANSPLTVTDNNRFMPDSGYSTQVPDVPTPSNTPVSESEALDEDVPDDLEEYTAVGVSYVPPERGQRSLSLNHQPPLVRALIKPAIHYMVGETLFRNAYIPLPDQEAFIRGLLTRLASSISSQALQDLVHEDERFVWLVTQLLLTRVSNIRGQVKKAVMPKVESLFAIPHDSEECKTYIKEILKTGDYIYPFREASNHEFHFFKTLTTFPQNGAVNRTAPFKHPIILSTLRDFIFSASRGSIAERHPKRFTSSITSAPQCDELEIPGSLVHASLQDWSGGFLKKTEFNAEMFEDVYRGHELFISNIRQTNIRKYHRLLSNLYNEVCVAHTQTASAIANNFMASVDLDGMEE